MRTGVWNVTVMKRKSLNIFLRIGLTAFWFSFQEVSDFKNGAIGNPSINSG